MAPDKPRASASIEFPLSEQERTIADLLPQMPPPPRWPAFNAVRHLNRAWKLKSSDPEMMVFRCITAEEEAATALFKCLQRRKYEGAEKLKPRQHIQKNAVIPFIEAVSRVFAEIPPDQQPETHLFLSTTTWPPEFEFRMKVAELPDGRVLWATSKPLHFSLTKPKAETEGVSVDFSAQMATIASEANAKSVRKYLEDRANQRNKLLYAASEGYFEISGDMEAIFRRHQRNVFTILTLYLMIDPYEKRQDFAQQCLSAFVKLVSAGPKEQIFE